MAPPLLCVLHFVLIHGACHGSWAWYRLEDQLQKAGHKVTSMDMTGAGINLADPDSITTWEEYHKPALDFFQSLPEPAPNEKVTSYLNPQRNNCGVLVESECKFWSAISFQAQRNIFTR